MPAISDSDLPEYGPYAYVFVQKLTGYFKLQVRFIEHFSAEEFLKDPEKGKKEVYAINNENGEEIMRGQVVAVAGNVNVFKNSILFKYLIFSEFTVIQLRILYFVFFYYN